MASSGHIVTEPSREFLANFARGCSGSLFEAVFDAEAIGRGPFSVNERLEVRGDKKIAVLRSKVEPSLLAGPRCAKTRHLRAYRVKK